MERKNVSLTQLSRTQFVISLFAGIRNFFFIYWQKLFYNIKILSTFAGQLSTTILIQFMANVIKIRKGLDINLKGKAVKTLM
ncbi:MAG: hypothetical protein LBT78_08630, partial [Tannerella sp.]|nr:hypothetical protein [Tannerella sp.]